MHVDLYVINVNTNTRTMSPALFVGRQRAALDRRRRMRACYAFVVDRREARSRSSLVAAAAGGAQCMLGQRSCIGEFATATPCALTANYFTLTDHLSGNRFTATQFSWHFDVLYGSRKMASLTHAQCGNSYNVT